MSYTGQKRPLIAYANLKTSYAMSTSWANVTGLSLTIPEDGWYRIVGEGQMSIVDTDGTSAVGSVGLAQNGDVLPNTPRRAVHGSSANNLEIEVPYHVEKIVYCISGDVVSTQAIMVAGDNSSIPFNSGLGEVYLMYQKL